MGLLSSLEHRILHFARHTGRVLADKCTSTCGGSLCAYIGPGIQGIWGKLGIMRRLTFYCVKGGTGIHTHWNTYYMGRNTSDSCISQILRWPYTLPHANHLPHGENDINQISQPWIAVDSNIMSHVRASQILTSVRLNNLATNFPSRGFFSDGTESPMRLLCA